MPAQRLRFIPARAGNTRGRRGSRAPTAVHPRSRGEHSIRRQRSSAGAGSSPLARGTPSIWWTLGGVLRFIPARAGNTCRTWRRTLPASVHPRSRGEHRLLVDSIDSSAGSSPLARGTRRRSAAMHRHARFIPARAGNTCAVAWKCVPNKVHPRSRGEHSCPRRSGRLTRGSSPLARGTPKPHSPGLMPTRFIPARAGNTNAPLRFYAIPDGSSPLARGTRDLPQPIAASGRFIPARAGNTAPAQSAACRTAVHPRSRGEHCQ